MKKIVLLMLMLLVVCFGEEASNEIAANYTDLLNSAVLSSTKELVYQLLALVVSIVVGYVGNLAREFLKTNKYAIEYNLNNEKTERVLANSIAYAEAKSKELLRDNISKRDIAISYIEKIDPTIIAKNGEKLELMIDRKVEQMYQKKTQANRGITISPTGIQKAVINTETIPTTEA